MYRRRNVIAFLHPFQRLSSHDFFSAFPSCDSLKTKVVFHGLFTDEWPQESGIFSVVTSVTDGAPFRHRVEVGEKTFEQTLMHEYAASGIESLPRSAIACD